MRTLKSNILAFSLVLVLNTNLLAWTSSNEGVCYTMDTLVQLSTDITYNATDQMFEVDCEIIILENDTLLILPGEILNFLGHYFIRVEGIFIAIGTNDNVIKLGNPNFTFSNGNYWCGIQIINSPSNKESTIKYSEIRGAVNLCSWLTDAESAIYCENSSPIIDHCKFSYLASDYETGGGSAIACMGQSYPIISYCKFEYLVNSIAIWCNPWDFVPDTINYPSPLVYGCNIMHSVLSFFIDEIDYDVVIYRGGFLDNCFLGAYNSNYVDTTLGIPIDTIGDGICNTTSTYWIKRFMDVDGVTHPRSDTLITDINENETEILPTTSQYLLQKNNYPNPFSGHTTIGFDVIPATAIISLSIIDSKGNIVRKLITNEPYKKGAHSIDWFGESDYGDRVDDGIYFYKLSSDDKVQVKKAIVVR